MRLFSGASGADDPQRHKSCRPRGSSLRGTRVGSFNPGSDCRVRWTHSPGCRPVCPPDKSTGPPTCRAAAWVTCAGETQALGQVKWEQLLAGPRGRSPTSLPGVPAPSCTAAAGRKDGPPGAADGPARPGGGVWMGPGWGQSPADHSGRGHREGAEGAEGPPFTQAEPGSPPFHKGSTVGKRLALPQPPNQARGGGRAPPHCLPGHPVPGPGVCPRGCRAARSSVASQDSCVWKRGCVAGSGVTAGKGDPDPPAPGMQVAVGLQSLLSPRAISELRQWIQDSEHTGQEADRC